MNSDGFCKTVAVGGARLPLYKNASRSCVLPWSLVEVEDVAAIMLGDKIAFLHQHFELIPASGFRQTHLCMDCFWRVFEIEAVLVSRKIQIEAQGGCIEHSVSLVQIALFDKQEVALFFAGHIPMHLHDALIRVRHNDSSLSELADFRQLVL